MKSHPLATRLRVALVRAGRRQRRERSSAVISDAQYGFLAALDRLGPMTPTALAECEGVQKPFATRSLGALAQAGLVSVAADQADGRRRVFTLTGAGRAEVVATRELRDEFLAAWLDTLTSAQVGTLTEAVDLLEELAAQ